MVPGPRDDLMALGEGGAVGKTSALGLGCNYCFVSLRSNLLIDMMFIEIPKAESAF